MSYKNNDEIENLKAKLNDSYEILSLLKEQHLKGGPSSETYPTNPDRNINQLEGAVNKLNENENQNPNLETVNQLENIQQEIYELKTIYQTMQQELSEIKQLLKEKNKPNNNNNTHLSSAPKNVPKGHKVPNYNQLQQLMKSKGYSKPTKTKQEINLSNSKTKKKSSRQSMQPKKNETNPKKSTQPDKVKNHKPTENKQQNDNKINSKNNQSSTLNQMFNSPFFRKRK